MGSGAKARGDFRSNRCFSVHRAYFVGNLPNRVGPLVVRFDDPRYKACRTACSVTAWLLSRHFRTSVADSRFPSSDRVTRWIYTDTGADEIGLGSNALAGGHDSRE